MRRQLFTDCTLIPEWSHWLLGMVMTMVAVSFAVQVMNQQVFPLHDVHRPPKEDEHHGNMGPQPNHRAAKLCCTDTDCIRRAIKTHIF